MTDLRHAPRSTAPAMTGDPQAHDLAANEAGAMARVRQEAVNRQAPLFNAVARLLGVTTDERIWRIIAIGQEQVGHRLEKLGPAWYVLHDITLLDPSGSDRDRAVRSGTDQRGFDDRSIDHLVIGPPGVLALKTSRHPGGRACVDERRVIVDGRGTDHVRNARRRARSAARLLTAATGGPVDVRAAVALVDLDDIKVKQMPADVHVTTLPRLIAWLESLPVTTTAETVDNLFAEARLGTTWRPPTPTGHDSAS